MKCPRCGVAAVVTSTRTPVPGTVRRQRKCPACSHTFSTVETVVERYARTPTQKPEPADDTDVR